MVQHMFILVVKQAVLLVLELKVQMELRLDILLDMILKDQML